MEGTLQQPVIIGCFFTSTPSTLSWTDDMVDIKALSERDWYPRSKRLTRKFTTSAIQDLNLVYKS